MPLDGSGVATRPPGTTAVAGQTITSAARNSIDDDLYAILNTFRPAFGGGTVNTPALVRAALDLEVGVDVQAYSADISDLVTAWTPASASGPASLAFLEDTDNGTNKITLIAPSSIASDKTVTFQDITGTLYVTGGTDVAVADGGTNFSSYTTGDIIYASGATTLTKLGIGTAGRRLRVNSGATAPEWADNTALESPVTVSGTAVNFTSIPSWVRTITMTLAGVSTNGTSTKLVQIGDSGGIETSGYLGSSSFVNDPGGYNSQQFTAGAGIYSATAADTLHGTITFDLVDASTNTWVINGTLSASNALTSFFVGGTTKSLTGTLDRVRLTTSGGTDTFDAGKVNISYA